MDWAGTYRSPIWMGFEESIYTWDLQPRLLLSFSFSEETIFSSAIKKDIEATLSMH